MPKRHCMRPSTRRPVPTQRHKYAQPSWRSASSRRSTRRNAGPEVPAAPLGLGVPPRVRRRCRRGARAPSQADQPLGGTVLGISEDDDQSAYDKFLKDYRIDFPAYRDPSKHQIALDYGTSMYPETYIIDPRGRIDRKIIGPQDWTSPEMLAYLSSLQQEK